VRLNMHEDVGEPPSYDTGSFQNRTGFEAEHRAIPSYPLRARQHARGRYLWTDRQGGWVTRQRDLDCISGGDGDGASDRTFVCSTRRTIPARRRRRLHRPARIRTTDAFLCGRAGGCLCRLDLDGDGCARDWREHAKLSAVLATTRGDWRGDGSRVARCAGVSRHR